MHFGDMEESINFDCQDMYYICIYRVINRKTKNSLSEDFFKAIEGLLIVVV